MYIHGLAFSKMLNKWCRYLLLFFYNNSKCAIGTRNEYDKVEKKW